MKREFIKKPDPFDTGNQAFSSPVRFACGDTDVIRAFAETDDFITKGCIDEYIQRAIECNQQEIYDILTAYSLQLKNDI